MMSSRVLISDQLSSAALKIFEAHGVEADFQPALGKDREKLAAAIGVIAAVALGGLLALAGCVPLAAPQPTRANVPSRCSPST